MREFRILALVMLLVLVLGSLAGVEAQDSTPEVTPEPTGVMLVEVTEVPVAVEQPPVVVVDNDPLLTWRTLGLYALVAFVVVVLGVIAYRLTTMVGVSYPPGTSLALERTREEAQKFVRASPNKLDDLGFYLADPLVQNAIRAVREREQAATQFPTDAGAG